MEHGGIAPHETIELSELLTFKNICLTKGVSMSLLVSDNELKGILQQDGDTTRRHIKELKALMETSNIAKMSTSENVSNSL